MTTFNRAEFWQELEATDEEFVKRKQALSGYSAPKKKVVAEWLNRKEDLRHEAQEALKHEVALKAVRWSMLNTIATLLTVAVAAAALFWPKLI